VTDRQLKTPAKEEICHAMEHMKGTFSWAVDGNCYRET
jgi:hypothetical protein